MKAGDSVLMMHFNFRKFRILVRSKTMLKLSLSVGLVFLFMLCGCQSPIVPVRNVHYIVHYSVGDQHFEISTTYKCYYEDVSWVSERGADWHIRGKQQVFAVGTLPSGERFVVQPVDSRMWSFFPYYRCPETETPIASELFIASGQHPRLESFDNLRTRSNNRKIRIEESLLRSSNGIGVFDPPKSFYNPTGGGKHYYTISARLLSGDEINRAGLRDYVSSRRSIWLKKDVVIPFSGWSRDDLQAARSYQEKMPYLYFPTSGLELTGNYSKQGWTFNRNTSTESVAWVQLPLSDHEALTTLDRRLPTTWVNFDGFRIEVPVAKYSALHFFNPTNDELAIFYVVKTVVPEG